VPRILAPSRRDTPRFAAPLPIRLPNTRPQPAARPEFAVRNSPIDLLFRALWQLVGVYVFVVLLIKDRRLPR